jgi:hypothetical protein
MAQSTVNYLWPQGDSHTVLPVVLGRRDGTTFDLAGTTISQIKMWARTVFGNVRGQFYELAGSCISINVPTSNGVFNFQFTASDVAIPGIYEIVPVITYSVDDVLRGIPARFEIISAM